MAQEQQAVVIVGMCRSGTSSVAGALSKLGVDFGSAENLYAGDSHNERGYWEHRQLNAAVRKFHMSLGLAAMDLDPIPEDWHERPRSEDLTASVARLVSTYFQGKPIWGWKDPQLSTLLPFLAEVLQRVEAVPVLIICVRNPLDVAASQVRRQAAPVEQTLGAWLLSTLAALRFSTSMRRAVVVYSQFLEDPASSLAPIAGWLKIDPGPGKWAAAAAFVESELSHGQDDRRRLSEFPSVLGQVYELCLDAARSPNLLNEGAFDGRVEKLWSEWKGWRGMFSRPPLPEASFNLSWTRRGERQVQENLYRPTRTWQTLRSSSRALAGSRVSIMIYPLPAVVWIRSAFWRKDGVRIEAHLLSGRDGQLDEEYGLKRVWLFHGYEQLAVDAPAASGPFELELDVLIESGNVIAGLTFQDQSRRLRGD